MIPILYNENETEFLTNGIGRLVDAISCTVTEERNGGFELEMTYSAAGALFEEIKHSRIILAKASDTGDTQPFRIYKITKPINGYITINAEHISYQLNYIPVLPFTAANVGSALAGLKTNSAEPNPFNFITDKSTEANYAQSVPESVRARLAGQMGSILDVYGGEYKWDRFNVYLLNNRGTDNGVTISYGKNLTDITQEENIESTFTGVCPFWTGEIDEQTVTVTLPEAVLHTAAAANYPYQRTVPLDLSERFEAQPTEAELRAAAQDYLDANNIGVPAVHIAVSFVALWQTPEYKNITALERVNLCDIVTVRFPRLGVEAKAEVIRTVYNTLLERYDKIEIGDAQTTLAKTIVNTETEVQNVLENNATYIEQKINNATKTLRGGLGGNVVINTDADGRPYEILIMDTDDVGTAVNVIRANMQGIGFSQNGYNGPFNSAWLINGQFNAQEANIVNFIADYITGGTLRLGGYNDASGVLELYGAAGAVIGTLTKDGLKMYGADGGYVIMNNDEGFAGYDKTGAKLYWVDGDQFHMARAVVEGDITQADLIRLTPVTIEENGIIVNEGIAHVSM